MVRRSARETLIAAPLPSGAELDILAVIWRLGPSTVREIHDALGKDSGYTTTLKQMQLMTEKGLLVRSERFRSHVYDAGVAKEQTQKQIAADMLKRGFEGSAKNLVLGALAAKPASRQELEEIRRILDAMDKGKESR
jgi:BlaI family transcriptional regulator, penicillinase repressor